VRKRGFKVAKKPAILEGKCENGQLQKKAILKKGPRIFQKKKDPRSKEKVKRKPRQAARESEPETPHESKRRGEAESSWGNTKKK